MLSAEILKKIKQIEIHTRKILASSFIGDSQSKQKGYGLEFEQLAEYQFGDDIRYIDWKSSARSRKLLIKEYREERSRLIYLLVDFSASAAFVTQQQSKQELMAHVAGVLALVGNYCKDYVGLIIFSDCIESVIPPGRGNQHAHEIVTRLFTSKASAKKTSLKTAIEYVSRMKKKDALVFIISDFIDTGYEDALRMLAKKSDVVAIRCLDSKEYQLPAVGFINTRDLETEKQITLDLTKKNNAINVLLRQSLDEQTVYFKKNGIDYLDIHTQTDFVKNIVQFMQRRIHH